MASRTSPERRRGKDAPTRPLMPRLAASTQSSASKQTPPPRLAGYVPPSSTPPLRRPLTTGSPNLKSSPFAATSTPVKNVDEGNVTPRSSARRNRASSARSTPGLSQDGTPTAARPKSMASPLNGTHKSTGSITKLMSGENSGPQAPRTNGAPASPRTSPLHTRKSMSLSPSQEGGFFYANTAKSSGELPKTNTPRGTYQSTRFVEPREAPALGSGNSKSPFLGVNRVQNGSIKSGSAPVSQVGASFGSANASKRPVRPIPVSSNTQPPTVFRAASPPKNGFHLSYRKGASQVNLTNPAFPFSPTLAPQKSPESIKRAHSRQQSSLDSDSDRLSQLTNGQSVAPGSPSSPQKTPPRPSRRSIETKIDTSIASELESTSPSIRSPSSIAAVSASSDLAANARRERKVLDLEISNSSLLAINKSLEREVYKQKSELRRFRRMTRNSNRSVSQASDDPSLASVSQLSGLTEEGEGEDDDGLDAVVDESIRNDGRLNSESDEEGSMSPKALEQSDARHRPAGHRRLRLDLSKHKQLIVDSQQMNQSLKRCLLISEQLIKDGNKALEYRAPVAEDHVGGRVLSPEEQEQYLEFGAYGSRTSDYFKSWDGAADASLDPLGPSLNTRLDGASMGKPLRPPDGIDASTGSRVTSGTMSASDEMF
ncbi:MAG: hypothetical protein M1828_000426 [Chrysothrix sp. TS-e1954]|nr:MAG: hypothetical protein M1828_000426 [Chrysothrix sp. TS-e1954]